LESGVLVASKSENLFRSGAKLEVSVGYKDRVKD